MKRKMNHFIVASLVLLLCTWMSDVSAWAGQDTREVKYNIVSGNNSITVNSDLKAYCRFIPEKSGVYDIYSVGSDDTYGRLFNSDWEEIAFNDDYQYDEYRSINFGITYELTAGKVYYIETGLNYVDSTNVISLVAEQQGTEKVTNFELESVKSNAVTLCWKQSKHADGYIVSTYDSGTKKYNSVKTISGVSNTRTTISGLKENTVYRFAVQSFLQSGSEMIYGKYSSIIMVRTNKSSTSIQKDNKKISAGYQAKMTNKKISLKGDVLTTIDSECESYSKNDDNSLLIPCWHGDYGAVSEITHFFDYKGYYTIVYENGKYVYFDRYTRALKFVSRMKISKKYPLLGDVVTDSKGNYYIVWGKNDTKGKGGVVTMAVSKYSYKGTYMKSAAYKTSGGKDSWETRYPFDAGNCSTIIDKDGILVCNYGREMYNGHQSNDILCVDTESMTAVGSYGNYVSHSFDQRVLELSDGGICFVNKGDAYPRGFDVEFFNCDKVSSVPFHFYGGCGVNYINAFLGGVVETGGNVYLVGSSVKSMTDDLENEGQNLFIQLAGSNRTISGSVNRQGSSCDESVTDEGIKWLTNYGSNYSVNNPQVVTADDGRMIVMWEKMYKGKFSKSYYMILAADGTVLQKATSMNKTRLTAHEDPLYSNGYVYWTTAGHIGKAVAKDSEGCYMSGYKIVNGNKAVIHKLKVGELYKP